MKGNTRVIDYLNKSLTHELTAVNQYWLHYRLLDDWGYQKLADKEREESIEEMQHADKLVTRIIFLEGFPNMHGKERIVSSLRHGLQQQHPRHHRSLGKVSLEKGFVVGNVLVTDQRFPCPELGDPVNQQEGITVRQMLQNIVDVHRSGLQVSC